MILPFRPPAKRTVRALVRSASACAGVEEQRQGFPRLLAGVGRRSDAARGPAHRKGKLPTIPPQGERCVCRCECNARASAKHTRGHAEKKRKMLQFFSSSYKENGNFGALFCFDQSVVGVAGLTALNRVAACLYIFFHGGPSDGFRR